VCSSDLSHSTATGRPLGRPREAPAARRSDERGLPRSRGRRRAPRSRSSTCDVGRTHHRRRFARGDSAALHHTLPSSTDKEDATHAVAIRPSCGLHDSCVCPGPPERRRPRDRRRDPRRAACAIRGYGVCSVRVFLPSHEPPFVISGGPNGRNTMRDGPVRSTRFAGTTSGAPVSDHRCDRCGYQIATASPFPRCPMCGVEEWKLVGVEGQRRPQAASV